ncbi:MAG: DNA repair protein RecO [Peptococcaceae bacterium]|nr:DNA repair protein RecO [Peptococcaceae bacterium]
MPQYKTEAVVLHCRKYREADGLLTLLTSQRGKVSAVARGVYKPGSKLRSGVQPFSVDEMLLNQGRSTLHTLLQSQSAEMFLPLRQSYEAMTYAAYWAELLETFSVEEMADQELYLLAKAGFYSLCLRADSLTCRALEVRLFQQQGLSPDFDHCANCGSGDLKDGRRFFSAASGGFLCGNCAEKARQVIRVGLASAALWRGLESMALDKLGRIKAQESQLKELGVLTRQWILLQTGRPLKSWPAVKKMEV